MTRRLTGRGGEAFERSKSESGAATERKQSGDGGEGVGGWGGQQRGCNISITAGAAGEWGRRPAHCVTNRLTALRSASGSAGGWGGALEMVENDKMAEAILSSTLFF